eukprot:6186952-Pleurochrysis_carterae.AAC.2
MGASSSATAASTVLRRCFAASPSLLLPVRYLARHFAQGRPLSFLPPHTFRNGGVCTRRATCSEPGSPLQRTRSHHDGTRAFSSSYRRLQAKARAKRSKPSGKDGARLCACARVCSQPRVRKRVLLADGSTEERTSIDARVRTRAHALLVDGRHAHFPVLQTASLQTPRSVYTLVPDYL